MTTFLTFVGIIALVVFGKFIFDTFLTNRTERDWNEYKQNHPDEAERVENNTRLNFESKATLRKDGVYIYQWSFNSIHNQAVKLTIFLAFNRHNRAYYGEAEGFMEIDKKGLTNFLSNIENEVELSDNITEYCLRDNRLTMKFGMDPRNCNEFSGRIVDRGLIVSWYYHGYNMSADSEFTKTRFENTRFKFISINDFS